MIIVLSGISGSGKTEYAKKLKSKGFKHIDCDKCGLKGLTRNSVIDFINLRKKDRIDLVKKLRDKFPGEEIICYWFQPNPEKSISRGRPESRIYLQTGIFEKPNISEGFDKVLEIKDDKMNKIAHEIIKIAKLLVSEQVEKKIIGNGIRVIQHDHYNIRVEELPVKGKKVLRIFNLSIWPGPHFHIFNNINILNRANITPTTDYDTAKASLIKAAEIMKKEEKEKYGTADNMLEHAYTTNESQVSWLKIMPEGNDPVLIDGKDFKLKSSWTKFSAYSPGSDLQSHDPSYTEIASPSSGAARKLYKILKRDPQALKDVGWGSFTDWLKRNGISYKHNFSQCR